MDLAKWLRHNVTAKLISQTPMKSFGDWHISYMFNYYNELIVEKRHITKYKNHLRLLLTLDLMNRNKAPTTELPKTTKKHLSSFEIMGLDSYYLNKIITNIYIHIF